MGLSLISTKTFLLLSIVIILITNVTSSNEHSSQQSKKTGDFPEPSRTVLKLHKKDDELARRIAAEHEMVVRGRPFLDSHYFIAHTSSELSQEKKRSIIASLNDHPDIISAIEYYPQIRVKRGILHESDKQNPDEFLKHIVEKRTNGTDYRGILSDLDEFLNIALGQKPECKMVD